MAIVRAATGAASVHAVDGWVIFRGVAMQPPQAREIAEALEAAASIADAHSEDDPLVLADRPSNEPRTVYG